MNPIAIEILRTVLIFTVPAGVLLFNRWDEQRRRAAHTIPPQAWTPPTQAAVPLFTSDGRPRVALYVRAEGLSKPEILTSAPASMAGRVALLDVRTFTAPGPSNAGAIVLVRGLVVISRTGAARPLVEDPHTWIPIHLFDTRSGVQLLNATNRIDVGELVSCQIEAAGDLDDAEIVAVSAIVVAE